MATRRSFIAGAVALAAAPQALTVASGAGAVYDPRRVRIMINGEEVRGPADGRLFVWTPTDLGPRPDHLRRHPRG